MKNLNKLGISILIGFLLSKTISSSDFEEIKNKLKNKTKLLMPDLDEHFLELTNLLDNNNSLSKNEDLRISEQLQKIKNKLQENNQDEIADLIWKEIKKENDE
ncbi:MAG: hypothetical protein K2I36_02850 [Ureaplasma sp.]|nr:hypothetical protein [Ureaplasma sp.]MDE7221795.1 hypothetical protein [Ureaplasma sp.]